MCIIADVTFTNDLRTLKRWQKQHTAASVQFLCTGSRLVIGDTRTRLFDLRQG